MSKVYSAKQAAFLAAYSELGNITAAAKVAGIDRVSHHRWIDDPEYAEAFAAAHEEAVEHLESEARRRAVLGVEEPVIYQGELQYVRDKRGHREKRKPLTIRKYSDVLLIFLLKGARPDKYRDNAKIEHTGPLGGPVRTKVDLSNLTDEQLATLDTLARAATGPIRDRSGDARPEAEPDQPLLPNDGSATA